MPVLATTTLCFRDWSFATGGPLLRLWLDCTPLQCVQQKLRQRGQDLSSGPGQSCAHNRQHPGSERYQRGLCLDPDDPWFWLQSWQAGCFCHRLFLFSKGDCSNRASGNACPALAAECPVHHRLAIHQVQGAVWTNLHARAATGTPFNVDGDHMHSPPLAHAGPSSFCSAALNASLTRPSSLAAVSISLAASC
jgi:hypothetical protein